MEPSCSSSLSSCDIEEKNSSFESSFIHDFNELKIEETNQNLTFWEEFVRLNAWSFSHEKIDLLSIDSMYWTIPFHEADEKSGILPLERLNMMSHTYPLIKTVFEELQLHRKSTLHGTISLLFQNDDLFQCSQEKLRLIFLQILSVTSQPSIMKHYGLDDVDKIVDLFDYARLITPRDLPAVKQLIRFICFQEEIASDEPTMHYFRKLLMHNVIPSEFVAQLSKYVHSFYQVILSDDMNNAPIFLPDITPTSMKKVTFSIPDTEPIQEICLAWSHTRYFLKWKEENCGCQNKLACSMRDITLETLPFCYCEEEDFCIRRAVEWENARQAQFY